MHQYTDFLSNRTRLINGQIIMNYQAVLKTVIWDSVHKDPNHIFKLFLCTFLNIFQASCPVKYNNMTRKNNWIA